MTHEDGVKMAAALTESVQGLNYPERAIILLAVAKICEALKIGFQYEGGSKGVFTFMRYAGR
jgi:hypothetical protein